MESKTTYGVLSIVCGALSWFILGIILAPAGLVLGIIGISKDSNKAPSVVGLVISAIALTVVVYSMLLVSAILK